MANNKYRTGIRREKSFRGTKKSVQLWGSSVETVGVISWMVTERREVAFVWERVAGGLCECRETTGECSSSLYVFWGAVLTLLTVVHLSDLPCSC
jgi:hypothetical protein